MVDHRQLEKSKKPFQCRISTAKLDSAFSTGAPSTSALPPALRGQIAPGDEIQNIVFAIGKKHDFEPLRAWFQALYETLLGSAQGPRMGSFIALYGVENVRKLIAESLSG